MAEAWDTRNSVQKKNAKGVFDKLIDAAGYAKEMEEKDHTEYGIRFDTLAKDGERVYLI